MDVVLLAPRKWEKGAPAACVPSKYVGKHTIYTRLPLIYIVVPSANPLVKQSCRRSWISQALKKLPFNLHQKALCPTSLTMKIDHIRYTLLRLYACPSCLSSRRSDYGQRLSSFERRRAMIVSIILIVLSSYDKYS